MPLCLHRGCGSWIHPTLTSGQQDQIGGNGILFTRLSRFFWHRQKFFGLVEMSEDQGCHASGALAQIAVWLVIGLTAPKVVSTPPE
jgi:hypothetical protein